MTKINDTLQEIINFFELEEGWDKREIITEMLEALDELRDSPIDEIILEWDDEELCSLENFADEFFDKVIAGVCNVIRSYIQPKEV